MKLVWPPVIVLKRIEDNNFPEDIRVIIDKNTHIQSIIPGPLISTITLSDPRHHVYHNIFWYPIFK